MPVNKWNKENPESVRKSQRKYYLKNKALILKRNSEWKRANREADRRHKRPIDRRYYLRHKERLNVERRMYYLKNKTRLREDARRRYKNRERGKYFHARYGDYGPAAIVELEIKREIIKIIPDKQKRRDKRNEWRRQQ